jgi:hypothetical protein
VRQDATGLLTTAAGGQAFKNSVVDVTNTTGAWTSLIAVTGVVVPPGNRPLKITATCAMTQAKSQSWQLSIFRSAISNSGTMEREWIINGSPVPNYNGTFFYNNPITDWNADGGTYVAYLPAGLTAGFYDWSFQLRNTGSAAASLLTTAHDNSPSTALAIGPTIFVEEL